MRASASPVSTVTRPVNAGSVLNAVQAHAITHLGAILVAGMGGDDRGHVVRRRLFVRCGVQDRGRVPRLPALLVGLHGERGHSRR